MLAEVRAQTMRVLALGTLPGVADAQDFDLASLSRLVHEAESVCCSISRIIGRDRLQPQMLQKEHDEHLHQSGVDLRPLAMLSQLYTLSRSSSMVSYFPLTLFASHHIRRTLHISSIPCVATLGQT